MAQQRFALSSRVVESLFNQICKQTPACQKRLLQHRIPSYQANSLITSRSPSFPAILPFSQVRYASHASQGTANAHSESSPGRRLGAKKGGDQYVIPGNIIFRQRGTKWFPGENCGMGRDHTIYALETGYVKFYKDPSRHPDRRYIGVAFNKEDKLPSPKNAPSKRRLGMVAVPLRDDDVEIAIETAPESGQSSVEPMKVKLVASSTSASTLRPGYMYRESNWEIGRVAEKAGIRVKEWKRKDRWTAWKKKLLKIQRIAQMKELKNRRKTKAKAAKKVARTA